MTLIRRDDKTVWLDLDPFYPPPLQHPNTVFKSWAIASQAMGADTKYVDLMGISGAAFRLQVGDNLCPSSPHPHLGFECDTLARDALGYEFVSYSANPYDEAAKGEVRGVIVQSIEQGHPLIADEEETGLVVGYYTEGDGILARHPYSNKGDDPGLLDEWPWSFTSIIGLPHALEPEGIIGSLEVAVQMAHTEELLGGYACGFAAYQRWIADLSGEMLLDRADIEPEAIVLGNAHIYYCLSDARTCAARYLEKIQPLLPPEVGERLQDAAEAYKEIALLLDTGTTYVPWPQELKSLEQWTPKHRSGQGMVLTDVLKLERTAVEAIEGVLETL